MSQLSRRRFLQASGAAVIPGGFDLLPDLERRACAYFYEQAHPETGLVRDRAVTEGGETRRVASIAATGFGLTALCIADQNGFIPSTLARQRAEVTVAFIAKRLFHQNGFYYHFVDFENGSRAFDCELSSVDTAWLLCGVIHARQHFNTPALRRSASEILRRVDWRWMLAGGETVCHGWTPENGFLPYRWDRYCELLAMYLLALGSATYAVPVSSWDAWARPLSQAGEPSAHIESAAPLFVHQYSHAWMDFRDRQDGYADYFANSREATLAHRAFCLSLRSRFPWIDENMWGITASDSRYGYIDWGGTATPSNAKIDGTLVPCAAGGSLVFLPDECARVLHAMYSRFGDRMWTRYGFVDAFNPGAGWASPDVVGIDLGIMLLMAENLRTQSVWRAIMSAPEVQRGFDAAAFA